MWAVSVKSVFLRRWLHQVMALVAVVAGAVFLAISTGETPPHPWLVRNQWVLYVALAVVVTVLVLIALRALRRPPEADEHSS